VQNVVEFLRRTWPLDATSAPVLRALYVDSVNGNNSNDGATPETAYQSLSKAMTVARMGDTINLASGTYSIGQGFFNKPVRLVGPPDRSALLKASLQAASITNMLWGELADLQLESDFRFFIENSKNILLSNCNVRAGVRGNVGAMDIESNSKVEIRNCVITSGNTLAVRVADTSRATMINATVLGLPKTVGIAPDTKVTIRNSILVGDDDFSTIADGNRVSITYSLTTSGNLGSGTGNLVEDPQFVDTTNGNYHLQPSSIAIDAGDPAEDYSNEPENNGNRINMGAYGNTSEAEVGNDTDGDGLTDQNERCYDGNCGGYNPYHSINNPAGRDLDYTLVDTDGDNFSDSQEIAENSNPLDANSIPPLTITSTPVTYAETGFAYSYQLTANWADVTYDLVSGPTGMIVNASSGLVSWTPSLGAEGNYSVNVRASAGSYSATQAYTLNVAAGNNGDLSEDGVIDVIDVLLIEQMVLGKKNPTPTQLIRGDVSGDGQLTISDFMRIQRTALGL
jgi:hypothetical protein